jgi:hypothetical protein
MKAFILFLVIGILSYIAGLYYPWWSLAVVAFVVTLVVPQKPVAAFFTAFIAVFVFWFSLAFFKDLANDHILAGRISLVFLGQKSPALLAAAGAVPAALTAGFAALSASFLRLRKKVRTSRFDKTFG